jgi:hypothetical protein
MIRRVLLALLAPLAAHAQLALFTFDGTTETPVQSVYNFGSVAPGDNQDIRFRARDTGTSAVILTKLSAGGAGFGIVGAPSLPFTIAPGNFLEFLVRFSAALPASYSASLQVNSSSVFLLASVVPAPALTVFPVCTVDYSANKIDFGNVQNQTLRLCNFSLQNLSAQPLVVSTLSVSGDLALQAAANLKTPFTLAASQAVTFTIQITPACGASSFLGTLNVNTRHYPLAGTSFDPPLPKPVLSFDQGVFKSGEQHTLTMSLPSAAICAAKGGYVNLVFTPGINSVTDDRSVVFLSGSTNSLPFSVSAGSTQISINGQSSVVFQTGTTEGAITFTVTGVPTSSDPRTVLTIAPAAIAIDTATASNQRLGNLDIEIIGFDNTYTAGAMSFVFFDTAGNTIGPGAVAADFTPAFKTYFASQQSGSTFLMRVSFPVTGNQTKVAGVEATLTNAAGPAKTGRLTFQ